MYSYQNTSQRGQAILVSQKMIGVRPALSIQVPVEDALVITNCVSMAETISQMTDDEIDLACALNVKKTLIGLRDAARRAIEVK